MPRGAYAQLPAGVALFRRGLLELLSEILDLERVPLVISLTVK